METGCQFRRHATKDPSMRRGCEACTVPSCHCSRCGGAAYCADTAQPVERAAPEYATSLSTTPIAPCYLLHNLLRCVPSAILTAFKKYATWYAIDCNMRVQSTALPNTLPAALLTSLRNTQPTAPTTTLPTAMPTAPPTMHTAIPAELHAELRGHCACSPLLCDQDMPLFARSDEESAVASMGWDRRGAEEMRRHMRWKEPDDADAAEPDDADS